MIAWIKKHWIILTAAIGGVLLLYWLYASGYLSSSASATTSCTPGDPTCDPNYAADLAAAQGGGIASGGGGGTTSNATPLVNLLTSPSTASTPATPGAVTQPGTSASGVPSYSNLTQEASVNTPTPAVSPVSLAASGAVTGGNASPLSNVTPSINPGVYMTPAYIEGLTQNALAVQSNEGLAPTFSQAQFNAAYGAAFGGGANQNSVPEFNAALGLQDVIAPDQVAIDQETAAFGSVANYNAAVNAGATVTGTAPNGQWTVNWGNYTGPGSPGASQSPAMLPPPATTPATTPPPRSTPSFTVGNLPGNSNVSRGVAAPVLPAVATPPVVTRTFLPFTPGKIPPPSTINRGLPLSP